MMKKNKGITLISLIIVIVLMVIITSTVTFISLDRFEINDTKKMVGDIEILNENVSVYYLKYGNLPILRYEDNTPKKYTADLNFSKNNEDLGNYYILDLEVIGNISLNYGEIGFKQAKNASNDGDITSKDIYIINEKSHTIYYVKGVKLKDQINYYINSDVLSVTDNIPPSKPEIKVISGATNENGIYISTVFIEIVPGKDNWSGVSSTNWTVNKDGTDISGEIVINNNIFRIEDIGSYSITAQSFDNSENASEEANLVIQIGSGSEGHIHVLETEGTITIQATCTTEGLMTYECTVEGCDYIQEVTIPAGGHSWNEGEITKAATCTETGIKTYTCTVCGETKTEEIPIVANAHDSNSIWPATKDPTCTEEGYEGWECRDCGHIEKETIIPALGHSWDEGEIIKAATCAETGTKRYTCTVCGYKTIGTIPKTEDHTWDSGEETTKATCQQEGTRTYTCTVCGATKTETIAKTECTVSILYSDCWNIQGDYGDYNDHKSCGEYCTWVTPLCWNEYGMKQARCITCKQVMTKMIENPKSILGDLSYGHQYDDSKPDATKVGDCGYETELYKCKRAACEHTRVDEVKKGTHTYAHSDGKVYCEPVILGYKIGAPISPWHKEWLVCKHCSVEYDQCLEWHYGDGERLESEILYGDSWDEVLCECGDVQCTDLSLGRLGVVSPFWAYWKAYGNNPSGFNNSNWRNFLERFKETEYIAGNKGSAGNVAYDELWQYSPHNKNSEAWAKALSDIGITDAENEKRCFNHDSQINHLFGGTLK